jgi:protein SCO1/2
MGKAGFALWGLCFLFMLGACHRERAPSRPVRVLGTVGAWQLTDQNGEVFESTRLDQKPYVVSFFFSSCQTVCPRISAAMAKLQDALIQENIDAQLLSITVDPHTDLPERLRAYAKKWGAKPERWTMLTGSEAELRDVVVGVFKTFMGKKETNEDGLLDIGHGAKLILVDGKSQVRGLFDANRESVGDVIVTLKKVLKDSN